MSAVARRLARIPGFVLPPIFVLLSFVRPSLSQTTVGTGGIVGTASGPFSAVISGAKVTITDIAKGQVIELAMNSSGSFNSGALKKETQKHCFSFCLNNAHRLPCTPQSSVAPCVDKVKALARNSDHSTKVIPVFSQWMRSRSMCKTGGRASIVFERESCCAVEPSECAKVGEHE
jgi:hypothetical protein